MNFNDSDGADSADMVSLIVSGVYSDKGKVYRSLSELSRSFVAGSNCYVKYITYISAYVGMRYFYDV